MPIPKLETFIKFNNHYNTYIIGFCKRYVDFTAPRGKGIVLYSFLEKRDRIIDLKILSFNKLNSEDYKQYNDEFCTFLRQYYGKNGDIKFKLKELLDDIS